MRCHNKPLIICVADGMAEGAAEECTPHNSALALAHTPCLDRLARSGMTGLCRVIPEGFEAGSELGNLALLGALMVDDGSARIAQVSRGPLEALAAGIDLGAGDLAFRLSLLGLDAVGRVVDLSPEWLGNQACPAGHNAEDAGVAAIRLLQRELASGLRAWGIELWPDQGCRHLLIWRGAKERMEPRCPASWSAEQTEGRFFLPSPIEALDKSGAELSSLWGESGIAGCNGSGVLRSFWRQASELLLPQKLLPWPWAGGEARSLELCPELRPLKRAVVAGAPMIRGLGLLLGYEAPLVSGATGLPGTNLKAKADAAANLVRQGFECVYVHVEEPDLAGHARNIQTKAAALARFDSGLLEPLCGQVPEALFLVICDHATSCRDGRHLNVELPFVLASLSANGVQKNIQPESFYENSALVTGVRLATAQKLMSICKKKLSE